MTRSDLPLKRIIRGEEVPEAGLDVSFDLDGDTRASIARLLDIPEVEALTADLQVTPWRRDGLAVRGRLKARVVQTCVVTLEPVHNAVDVDIEDYYAPDPERLGRSLEVAEAEIPPAEEIEPLVNDRIDVGGLVVEHLALGLDPYPRCPGVEFDSQAFSEGAVEEHNPFAALAGWKQRNEKE